MLDGDEGTTGFGISAEIGDNEYPILVCDTDDETVWVEAKSGELIRKMPMGVFAALPNDGCDRRVLQVPA
jgi:hypothetical protein